MATVTKVYDTHAAAQQAVRDLENAGIPSDEISLVANRHVSEEYDDVKTSSEAGPGAGIGAAVGGGVGLLAGLGMLAIPGIGPVVAAGWLASTAAGAVAGGAAGGIIGAMIDSGVAEEEAHVYSEAVRRGGTLLTVRTEAASEGEVRGILDRYSPVDVATRGEEYRQQGWDRFDPDAPDYEPSAEEIERMRRPL